MLLFHFCVILEYINAKFIFGGTMKKRLLPLLLLPTLALAETAAPKKLDPVLLGLGQKMFFDKSLSFNKTQSCATCHMPDAAFADLRDNDIGKMVSQGDDPTKFGNRNSPTALYAKFSPDFHFDEKLQDYVGGQFWDGRAKDLAEQAGGPPVNPVEMGMPDKATVAKRITENPAYEKFITKNFGNEILKDENQVYALMEKALAEFEHLDLFAQFSSKYDKSLVGEYQLTEQEALGKALFFDQEKTNCSSCHQLQAKDHKEETFTNHRYFNLGVPKNKALLAHNQLGEDWVDNGLLDNPMVKGDERQKGKFKVPTLRNVAVTAPYMHNGVFKELRTVLLFLDSKNNPERTTNPETGKPWEEAEYAPTVSHDALKGKPLTDAEIDALEAFLKTLTDAPYEE